MARFTKKPKGPVPPPPHPWPAGTIVYLVGPPERMQGWRCEIQGQDVHGANRYALKLLDRPLPYYAAMYIRGRKPKSAYQITRRWEEVRREPFPADQVGDGTDHVDRWMGGPLDA